MSTNFLLDDDLLLSDKIKSLNKDIEPETENNKYYKILYNKKWLIIIGLLIIGIIFYLYYNNISFALPCILKIPNINKKKKSNKEKEEKKDAEDEEDDDDEETEESDSDNWNLENEIQTYMKKQHEIISELK